MVYIHQKPDIWSFVVWYRQNDFNRDFRNITVLASTQPGFTCPKLRIETLEQSVKYVYVWWSIFAK